MEIQVTEFRPANIGHLFGQEHLTETLAEWTEHPEHIPHSLLITGPYGTGKTSIARILARYLTDQPRDVKEINAAESRGIDDVREWVDACRYAPLGKARIFVIDELHQMTQQAQSALLKVIEEPGQRLYFFLCTTEPSRLLPAIRSRCSPIEVRLLTEPAAEDLIGFLSKGKVTPESAKAIFQRSGGHARDIVKMVAMLSYTNYTSLPAELPGMTSEDFKSILLQGAYTDDDIRKMLSASDPVMMSSTLDSIVDQKVIAGDKDYLSVYDRLLQMRVLRREYKVSVQEQLLHYISVTKVGQSR